MTPEPATPMVWLGTGGPDMDQSRALAGWARARGVSLVLPSEETARAPDTRSSTDLADDEDRLLDRVRDAIAGRDGEAADGALAAAESGLRAHPELPQAAWLMAEVERARSSRFRRVQPLDEQAAERAWMRAEALDGGRVPGVGERASALHPVDANVALDPLPAIESLRLDGHPEPLGGGVVATHAGLHALMVIRGGTPIWARWIDAPAGSSALHLALPASPPCSIGDLAPARLSGVAVDAAGVRCASWVAAIPGSRQDSVLVAPCEADRCGAFGPWSALDPGRWTYTPVVERPRAGWPGWATWGLIGAGAVIATGVVVVASAVLQTGPVETRFVSGGVKAQ